MHYPWSHLLIIFFFLSSCPSGPPMEVFLTGFPSPGPSPLAEARSLRIAALRSCLRRRAITWGGGEGTHKMGHITYYTIQMVLRIHNGDGTAHTQWRWYCAYTIPRIVYTTNLQGIKLTDLVRIAQIESLQTALINIATGFQIVLFSIVYKIFGKRFGSYKLLLGVVLYTNCSLGPGCLAFIIADGISSGVVIKRGSNA